MGAYCRDPVLLRKEAPAEVCYCRDLQRASAQKLPEGLFRLLLDTGDGSRKGKEINAGLESSQIPFLSLLPSVILDGVLHDQL